jgi:hypothetical protein
MGKWVAIASSVLFFITLASAEAQSGNAFFGYSYYNSTNLSSPALGRASTDGWEASVEGKILPFVGLVAEFEGLFGSQSISNCGQGCGPFRSATSQYNYLFGPRVSVSRSKLRPFAEVLIGGSHMNVHIFPPSTSSIAIAAGGGFDYRVLRFIAWRLQGDYIYTNFFNATQNNLRVSTGIVFRF